MLKVIQVLKFRQAHKTQMFWSKDRAKPQPGDNPEEKKFHKEYTEVFNTMNHFLNPH